MMTASLYLDLVMEQYQVILDIANIVISPIQPSYTYIFMLINTMIGFSAVKMQWMVCVNMAH